jgi:hypothetical protein
VMRGLSCDIDAINHPGSNVDGSIGVNIIRPNSRYINGWPPTDAELGRRMSRSESAGWAAGMLQSVSEGQETAHPELPERRSGFFIDLGTDVGATSGFGNIHSPHPVGTPNTFLPSDVHPAYRDTVNSTF